MVALWVLVPWRPKLRLDRAQLPGLLRFGGALTGVDITAAVTANADYVFVGKVLGPAALGLYTLAFRLPELAIVNVATVAGIVLFPAFANVERSALAHTYTVSLRYLLMLCMPVAAAVALLAAPLVEVAFGPKWHGAVEPMRLLTIYAFAVTVGIPGWYGVQGGGPRWRAAQARGAADRMLVVGVAIFVSSGITAVAATHAVVAGLFSVIGILRVAPARRAALAPGRASARLRSVATAAMSAVVIGRRLGVRLGMGDRVVGGAWRAAPCMWPCSRCSRRMRYATCATSWRRAPPRAAPEEWTPLTVARETDVIA